MENDLEKELTVLLTEKTVLSECEIYQDPSMVGWAEDQGIIYRELERLFQENKILKLVCQTPASIEDPSLQENDIYGQPFYMLSR